MEIIKNGALLSVDELDRPVESIEYVDRTPVNGAFYGPEECLHRGGRFFINRYSDNPVDPHGLNTNGADFYLVRVVSRNGRTSYAGPIWVEAARKN